MFAADDTVSQQKRKFLAGGKFYHVNMNKKKCLDADDVVFLAESSPRSSRSSLSPAVSVPPEEPAPIAPTTISTSSIESFSSSIASYRASTNSSSASSRLDLSPVPNAALNYVKETYFFDLTVDNAETSSSSLVSSPKASTATSLSPAPNSNAVSDIIESPISSATIKPVVESDIFDLTVEDADTLKAGDYLHFRKSFKNTMRTLRIRRIVKYTMVVEDRRNVSDVLEDQATIYEVVWKVYFDSPPDDEQYVTTLLERGGRRFQKVGTKQYVPLFRYNFVHCIARNSWDVTWEKD
jgi:hypothetical protein